MIEKIERIKAALPWLFSTHYKIERFGILFFLLVGCLLFTFGVAKKTDMDNQRMMLGNNVVYTTQAKMSLSHADLSVIDIRVSKDKTKCFMMLKWNNTSKVITDASAYSVYLCGANAKGKYEKLLSRPTATVYMFGATGYMGVYLVDTNGFPSQIISMTLRSENNFVSASGPIKDAQGDDSFLEHDQARIYFNPGGAAARTVSCLETGKMSAFDIYCSFFVEEKEAKIKADMDVALQTMYDQAMIVDNVTQTLPTNLNLQPPKSPPEVSELDKAKAPYDELFDFDDKGKPIELHATSNVVNNVLFDWRGGSIEQGYSDEVLAKYNYRDLSSLLKAKTTRSTNSLSTNITWYDISGVIYTPSYSGASPAEANRNKAISTLTDAWIEYFSAKEDYQRDLPLALLTLERNARETVALYSVKTENVCMLY